MKKAHVWLRSQRARPGEESNKYYNQDAKPGSLASKAGMVAKYNERQEKGNKK